MTERSIHFLSTGLWTTVGLAVVLAVWSWGNREMGPLALPSPGETFTTLLHMIASGKAAAALSSTGVRVGMGFCVALAVGTAFGVCAGLLFPVRAAIGPILRALLAVPPIAWVVLSLLWFGTGGGAVVFTIFVAILPVIFLAALRGTVTVNAELEEMTAAFRLSASQRLRHLVLPNLSSYTLPAAVTAFGLSWKVCVMAELLAARDGVGAELALARANLDTAEVFSWILLVVAAFLIIEGSIAFCSGRFRIEEAITGRST